MQRSERRRRRATNPKGPAVTLEMVAREAGVSPSTVSRILNGTARVRDTKARAVEAAIARLQFKPDPVARSLARGRSMSIGVVTQAIESPFYGEVLAAIEKGLIRASYSPLFVSGHWREADERRCVSHLLSRRVDGIILLTSCLPEEELVELSQTVPLVLTGRRVRAERIHCLDVDSTAGARLATTYLLEQGHRRIAFISGPGNHLDAIQRLNGYKSALAAARVPYNGKLVAAGDYTESGGHAAMKLLLERRTGLTAVFASNDQSAYGAMLALHDHGLGVPQDVSIMGFDDLPASAYTIPRLTTLHRSNDQVGEGAAEAMIDLVSGRRPVARKVEMTLAIRESTRVLRR
jgi:LacI family transcriptional regulator